ncbi:MAG: plasmid mobilization protein [Lachnospiraceae bacterium]
MAGKRSRELQLNFRVSPQELKLIEEKMSQLGTNNREAYLRKMAIDGYVVKLDFPEVKELVSLLRYSSNNLNQLTKRVHETGRVYDTDLEDILQKQDAIWDGVNKILARLGSFS